MTDTTQSYEGDGDIHSTRRAVAMAVLCGIMVYAALHFGGDPFFWAMAVVFGLFTFVFLFRYATRTICAILLKQRN